MLLAITPTKIQINKDPIGGRDITNTTNLEERLKT